MRVFLVCPMTGVSDVVHMEIASYVASLEAEGCDVYWPHRDASQEARSWGFYKQNKEAIRTADEIHVWFDPKSSESGFDLGMVAALGKKVAAVDSGDFIEFWNFWDVVGTICSYYDQYVSPRGVYEMVKWYDTPERRILLGLCFAKNVKLTLGEEVDIGPTDDKSFDNLVLMMAGEFGKGELP